MILIAGVGNIFLGDDAFGSEVARRLSERPLPSNVRVIDFGIRGLDLAYALLDEHEALILIDATQRGEPPGTLYLIEPDLEEISSAEMLIETHRMDPMRVLALARSMGANLERIRILGCEPEVLDCDDGHIGLSPRVSAAVDEAIRIVESLIQEALV